MINQKRISIVALALKGALIDFKYMLELFAGVVLGTLLVLTVKSPSPPCRDEQAASRTTVGQIAVGKLDQCGAASCL